jgi:hypothetical protein
MSKECQILVPSIYYLICYLINNIEIENLKVVKSESQSLKTPEVQHFKFILYETDTITLLELPSLAPFIQNISDTQVKVCIKY